MISFFGYSIIKHPQDISQLNLVTASISAHARSHARILAIDNENFSPKTVLENRGFSIRHLKDLSDPSQAKDYDIILCDIKGVGESFESQLEGAYLAVRIKTIYPHKKVIFYTSSGYDGKYNDSLKKIDGYIDKDANSDDWEELLNKFVLECSNPLSQWKIVRAGLLLNDVPILNVMNLEGRYIQAVINKNSALFPGDGLLDNLPEEIKGVVTSVAKSLVFKLIGLPG